MKTKYKLVINCKPTYTADRRPIVINTDDYAIIDMTLHDYKLIGPEAPRNTKRHAIRKPICNYEFFHRHNCSAILIVRND